MSFLFPMESVCEESDLCFQPNVISWWFSSLFSEFTLWFLLFVNPQGFKITFWLSCSSDFDLTLLSRGQWQSINSTGHTLNFTSSSSCPGLFCRHSALCAAAWLLSYKISDMSSFQTGSPCKLSSHLITVLHLLGLPASFQTFEVVSSFFAGLSSILFVPCYCLTPFELLQFLWFSLPSSDRFSSSCLLFVHWFIRLPWSHSLYILCPLLLYIWNQESVPFFKEVWI